MVLTAASLNRHALCDIHILINLIEVQVFVDRPAIFVDDAHGFVVLVHCRNVTQLGGDRCQSECSCAGGATLTDSS